MSNRNFPSQKVFGWHMLPVRLDFKFSIGSAGAPTLSASPANLGINTVTRLDTGIYQLQLQDNYAKFLEFQSSIEPPNVNSNVNITALTPGKVYRINALGTSTQANWVTAGMAPGITAAAGVIFKAAATSTGTGNARLAGASPGIYSINLLHNPNSTLNNLPYQYPNGGFVVMGCYGPTVPGASSPDATPILTDPPDGTVIQGSVWVNNSNVQ